MPLVTRNPTAFASPDPGQGGLAVTTPSVTGHSSTTASVIGSIGLQEKTCKWTGFPSTAGQIQSITLKFDHTSSGTLAGPSRSNTFVVQYSLNGGSNWTTAVQRVDFTSSQGPTTFSVSLPLTQDLTQVQLRDSLLADTLPDGGTVNCTATIANILIEVQIYDAPLIVMM
jgi:hypothetical protein